MVVTVMMLLLLGMLEFGFIFDQHLTIEYGSREGARVGAALANGTPTAPCATVDNNVIAAVQRVLASPGSRVTLSRVSEIRIYKANASGTQTGSLYNRWTYQAAGGPSRRRQAPRLQERPDQLVGVHPQQHHDGPRLDRGAAHLLLRACHADVGRHELLRRARAGHDPDHRQDRHGPQSRKLTDEDPDHSPFPIAAARPVRSSSSSRAR